MAFESLTEKFQAVFKNLRGKGRLSEQDVTSAMREVKMALLEADVNFKVVKNFVRTVQERAVGQEVMNSLTPGQQVIKIVNEELTNLLGGQVAELPLLPSGQITVLMLCGLQGAGKTTAAAKLAGQLRTKGKRPLLVACDVYRPAAIKQLQVNGEKVGVPVFSMGEGYSPVAIAKAAYEHAEKNGNQVVILDTAGRLHIDQDMMEELVAIQDAVPVTMSILVVDAMTGQDAVNVAKAFTEQVGIGGVILTKLDGDTRGGAALSIRQVTGTPILFAGMGEKLTDLEPFYPDRMASRILGMGDLLSLIDKASQIEMDDAKAKEMERKFRKAEYNFDDYLEQMQQIRQMGGFADLIAMVPGMGNQLKGQDLEGSEQALHQAEAIIHSMTKEERANPSLLNPSRKNRIARGAGVDISIVNRFVKQFDSAKKVMKQMSGAMMGRGRRKGRFPFGR